MEAASIHLYCRTARTIIFRVSNTEPLSVMTGNDIGLPADFETSGSTQNHKGLVQLYSYRSSETTLT